jgi:Trypsin-co-occurring domain 2
LTRQKLRLNSFSTLQLEEKMSPKFCIAFLGVFLMGAMAMSQVAPNAANNPESPVINTQDVVAIQAVISEISDALVKVQNDLQGKKLPPLASVDLTLKTIVEKDAGGTFKLWIISFGAKREKDQTQTLTIHLTPPSPDNPQKTGTANLTAALESAIVSAAEGAQQSGSKDYPLDFSGLTVEMEFTVKVTGNAGVKIPIITPITADLSGNISRNATQNMKIVFQDPKKKGTT